MRRKKISGSISALLAVTLTMVLAFCMVLIEGARESVMLLKADMVLDIGGSCLLAEYHQRLWEEYDILYIDCGYGETPSYDNVKEHLETYINANTENDSNGWLGLSCQDVRFSGVDLATDLGGQDFFLQAVSAAKESVGITYIEEIFSWFEKAQYSQEIQEELSVTKEHIDTQIEEANGTVVEVKEPVWGMDKNGEPVLIEEGEYQEIQVENPLDKVLSVNFLLKQIIEYSSDISGAQADVSETVSRRELSVGSSQANEEAKGLGNKLFFCKYLMEHFKSFTDDTRAKEGQLRYSLEYLIGGRGRDSSNLEVVAAKMLAIREVDNYLSLLGNEAKKLEAHTIAAASAGAALWLEPVVYQALLLLWAYEESIEDLQTLFSGGEIPLVKAGNLDELVNVRLNYEEYLLLLLMLQGREKITLRAMDIIEMDIRQEQKDFYMDGCISKVQMKAVFRDNYDKEYYISQRAAYS